MRGAPRGLAVAGVRRGVARPGIPGDMRRWVSAAAADNAIRRHSSSETYSSTVPWFTLADFSRRHPSLYAPLCISYGTYGYKGHMDLDFHNQLFCLVRYYRKISLKQPGTFSYTHLFSTLSGITPPKRRFTHVYILIVIIISRRFIIMKTYLIYLGRKSELKNFAVLLYLQLRGLWSLNPCRFH